MDFSNPYVIGLLGAVVVFALFLVAARFFGAQLRRKRRVLKGERGIACPSCGTRFPAWRMPKNSRQLWLGVRTCASCGDECDRNLDPVPKDVAARSRRS